MYLIKLTDLLGGNHINVSNDCQICWVGGTVMYLIFTDLLGRRHGDVSKIHRSAG